MLSVKFAQLYIVEVDDDNRLLGSTNGSCVIPDSVGVIEGVCVWRALRGRD